VRGSSKQEAGAGGDKVRGEGLQGKAYSILRESAGARA